MANLTLNVTAPAMAKEEYVDKVFYATAITIIGILAMVTNLFVLTVICTHKSMHSPCFILIAGNSLCSVIRGVGFVLNGVDKTLTILDVMSDNRTRLSCYLLKAVPSIPPTSMVPTLISVDRLVSIFFPVHYMKSAMRIVKRLLSLAYAYAAVCVFINLYNGPPMLTVIFCPNIFASFDVGYKQFFTASNLAFCLLNIVLYAFVMLCFEVKRRRLNSATDAMAKTQAEMFVKHQAAILPTVKLLIFLYIVTGVIPELWANAQQLSPLLIYYSARTYPYAAAFKSCCSMAEIISLSVRSEKFRESARSTMFRSKTSSAVHSIPHEKTPHGNKIGATGLNAKGQVGR